MNELYGVGILLLLILVNAFFVAAEYALVSLRDTRISQLVEEGSSSAKLVQRAKKNMSLYIAATQLGITVAALATGYVAEPSLGHLLEIPLSALGLAESTVKTVGLVLSLGISTILAVIFAEIVPKSLAIQKPEQVAFATILPLSIFTTVFGPISRLLSIAGSRIVRLFGVKAVDGFHGALSEEEIRMVVNASTQQGVFEEDEKILFVNALDFSDKIVDDVMIPRVDAIGIDADTTLREFLEMNAEHGYSRYPVYRETIDHIIGVAHVSDCLKHLEELDRFKVSQIARQTYYAPEGQKMMKLFAELRDKKIHMAVVVDEQGGTHGIVTLEDVLEELVGEIYDETDEVEESGVKRLDGGAYLLDGSLKVNEVEEALNIELDPEDESEFNTLAGFITQQFGEIPKVGAETVFAGWTFRVDAADQRKVIRVRAHKSSRTNSNGEPMPEAETHSDNAKPLVN
jgi:putative hemolysin